MCTLILSEILTGLGIIMGLYWSMKGIDSTRVKLSGLDPLKEQFEFFKLLHFMGFLYTPEN